jgi:hypothetical protein
LLPSVGDDIIIELIGSAAVMDRIRPLRSVVTKPTLVVADGFDVGRKFSMTRTRWTSMVLFHPGGATSDSLIFGRRC